MDERFRKLGKYLPDYGQCVGYRSNCAIVREDLDPYDQLGYDHDWGRYWASQIADEYERQKAYEEADKLFLEGLMALTEEDFKKIPVFVWERPFFKRAYAKKHCKAAILAFQLNEINEG